MGRITDEDVSRVRDATDLVQLISERIVLKPKGRLFWGLCPFHGEKTPSFKVDPTTQLWHCFGCGLGGDSFGFVMRTDNVDFPDAVRILADRAHIEIVETQGGAVPGRKDRLYAVCEEAAEFYHRVLTGSRESGPTAARDYLGGRGFGSDVAKRWRLGYAPGRGALVKHLKQAGFSADEMVDANLALRNDDGRLKDRFYDRVMFPISDLNGRVIAYGGRVMGKGEPKYLNTNDTPIFHKSAHLYAIERAKAAITATGDAVVVEGYTDVIALHEAGITNAIATLGTALTKQHVKLLGRFAKRIVYLFDGDEAGMRAADRASEFIDASVTPEAGGGRVQLVVAVLPDGLDPADLVAQRGSEALTSVIAGAAPLLQFAIDRRLARWDLDRPEERARALKDAAAVLTPVKDSLLADDYANYIADRLFADFATVRRAINETRPAPAVRDADEGEGAAAPSATGLSAAVDPRSKVERQLLALYIQAPSLRGEARELLTAGLLSDANHRALAEVVAEAGPSVSPASLVGALDAAVPGAAEAFSAMTVSFEGADDAKDLAAGLTLRLKELELERRIAVGKARLKRPAEFKDKAEEAELFKEIAELQRALDTMRRSAGDDR